MIVLGMTLFWSFGAKKGPKWAQSKAFQVIPKVNEWNFSDFLHEITAA